MVKPWQLIMPGKVNADASLIQHVITNLLTNAIKFTQHAEEAEIDVGSINKDNQIIYYVKDNGAGFNMKYAGKLFNVFQKLHSAKEFEGSGVGLAIAYKIIQRHGGKIWAEAEINKGATFYFTLTR
jgi:two-component system sensor histidine kinase/response regulator